MGNLVKASTTSESRFQELSSIKAEPFLVDIERLSSDLQTFLQANILIINIPSKNIEGFIKLLKEIEKSDIEKVLFVSSTSVYENKNKTILESDGEESTLSPLLTIENLFRSSNKIRTTIVRFGGLIGYSRNPGKFFSKGRIIRNPESNVNLIHRDDCIGIISQIVEQDVWGEVFNCCADTHPTKRDFYTQAAKSTGFPVPKKVKQQLNYKFLYADLMNIKF
jgi:nucleoside-diphosphate-sugar epimerase